MIKKFLLLLLLVYSIESLPIYAQQSLSAEKSRPTVKLSPHIRIIEREQRIPTIPREAIQQFLSHPQVIIEEEIETAGYIIGNAQQSVLSTQGSQIYVTGFYEDSVGMHYQIVRFGETYRNRKDKENEVLAYEAIYLGKAILKRPGEPAILTVIKANREIRKGDLLLPLKERVLYDDFYPHSPESIEEETYIIAVVDSTLLIGQYQIVIINKGLDNGIENGHLLAINKARRPFENAIDFKKKFALPKQRVGTLLVFHTFDRVSYALVMSATLPINVFDEVSIP